MLTVPLRFYATAPYRCSYLCDELARSQVATPPGFVNSDVYSQLIRLGFRRSGLHTYKPYCDQCNACVPCRIAIADFSPNRTQRRLHNKQHLFSTQIHDLHFSAEHYQLYQRYQQTRHSGSGMDQDSESQYKEFLLESHVSSLLIEHRDATTNELKIVSIIDVVEDGISAVYTFYDPNSKFGYGTWNILWQINYCKMLQLPYLYLGYWIETCTKMAYKSHFQALEGYLNEHWTPLNLS